MAVGKVSEVVRLTDELAVDIALEMLGRPPKLRPEAGQDTIGGETKPLDAKFQALARLTSWVAVKNRIDDDEPERDFFSGARAKLSRKARGRGGPGTGPALPADGSGGADDAAPVGPGDGAADAPGASPGDPAPAPNGHATPGA